MKDMNLRDLIAHMTTAFDPNVAGNLVAIIQFHATGKEPGNYYLHIENGKCTFNEDVAESPTVTIHTPSEVWIAINTGEMDGAQAFMQGKFRVEGDFGLLMKMRDLFKRS
jgi:putative sterol carrier protein